MIAAGEFSGDPGGSRVGGHGRRRLAGCAPADERVSGSSGAPGAAYRLFPAWAMFYTAVLAPF